MEIKAQLNKPYSKSQKLDFIVQYNHNLGYKIEETSNALEAWGKIPAEIEEEEKEIQKILIQLQLDDLDKKRIRAVCEPSMKTEAQSWLDFYNNEVQKLRQVMANLENN